VRADPRAAFLQACALDVAVRKPGNVSQAAPGHGMQAAQFHASAQAAAGPLCTPGAPVGARIESAVRASWQAAGCNTNLGIVLLCAPLACAAEQAPPGASAAQLRATLQQVLAGLDQADAAAAFRAIALANPGGLGRAPAQDVRSAPTVTLRQAMALAAERDLIAGQYRNGFADVFDTGLPALPAGSPDAAAVQGLYLAWLSAYPDSHIVRKHGAAVAQTVMQAAQGWQARVKAGLLPDDSPDWAAWDEALKARHINPGTSADLTVATLMLAALLRPCGHGS
jgi:triphosphoribosyl-dephospho-CoA synthase